MKSNKKIYIFNYSMLFVNLLSLIIAVVMCFFTYYLVNFTGMFDNVMSVFINESYFHMVIFIIIMFLWFVLHELIHGLFYRFGGVKKENVTYGIALEKGIFFCKCSKFIGKKSIFMSLLAPFIILGVITYIFGFIFHQGWLIVLSVMNIIGCAGDLAMFFFFFNRKDDVEFMELGDSTKFYLKTSEELNDKKFLSVKLEDVVLDKNIEEEKTKKININKNSWYILIIFIIILFLFTLLKFM